MQNCAAIFVQTWFDTEYYGWISKWLADRKHLIWKPNLIIVHWDMITNNVFFLHYPGGGCHGHYCCFSYSIILVLPYKWEMSSCTSLVVIELPWRLCHPEPCCVSLWSLLTCDSSDSVRKSVNADFWVMLMKQCFSKKSRRTGGGGRCFVRTSLGCPSVGLVAQASTVGQVWQHTLAAQSYMSNALHTAIHCESDILLFKGPRLGQLRWVGGIN